MRRNLSPIRRKPSCACFTRPRLKARVHGGSRRGGDPPPYGRAPECGVANPVRARTVAPRAQTRVITHKPFGNPPKAPCMSPSRIRASKRECHAAASKRPSRPPSVGRLRARTSSAREQPISASSRNLRYHAPSFRQCAESRQPLCGMHPRVFKRGVRKRRFFRAVRRNAQDPFFRRKEKSENSLNGLPL